MNGYVCFYERQRAEVRALTTLEARNAVLLIFQRTTRRKVKPHEISVALAERPDGTPVIHNPN